MAHDGRGKPIISLAATAKDGKISKIVPYIQEGAGVVTTRAHAHYIVTEYGIASLWGKSLTQRARALIDVAHPDHREFLHKEAYNRFKVLV